ncbi:unnamed protein product [Arabidopsis arenosa]|uniref:Uncharacterized protein n=1 Tax=Arabidopsis arenosa TaxID=38785 RepID=A0A8S2AZY0_ARAAE|nr:unnamed protein product [Arabidopsis arenosa]
MSKVTVKKAALFYLKLVLWFQCDFSHTTARGHEFDSLGPKGIVESEGEADNYQKEMEKKKFDKEAQKLWLRMRNEVITELQEKGHNLE